MTTRLALTLVAGMAMPVPALALAQDAPPPPAEAPAKQDAPPRIYDEAAVGAEQVSAALDRARRENRRVLIQWGANWCGWCRILHDGFKSNSDISRKLLYEYDVVLIDIGQWDKHLDLVEKYGADIKGKGVPYLTVLDADGKVLANQDTGSLEKEIDGKPGHDAGKVMAFLSTHQAKYLPAESVLADAKTRAASEDKRLFVQFSAPWCGWCHRLQAWWETPEVAEIFGRDFVPVKIDIERTVGGNEVMAEYRRSNRGGIPWFVFTEADGTAIATSEWGEIGNLGRLVTDEEIDAFGEIIAKVARRLTAEDIDALELSLGRSRTRRN